MQDRDDQTLLREYAGRQSDEAFAELARRHSPLVYGTALRKLGDPSSAEEISQAVFMALAKKAPFLCHRENLSGWLHQTTILECRQQLRGELRRRRREEYVMQTRLNNATAPAGNDLAAELDDALLEIPEKERQPLLLRFFDSLSLREVAAALGIREDAAQKRITKSLGLLERILRRRGRDIGGAALIALLAESSHAVPAHLPWVISKAVAATAMPAAGTGAMVFAKFMALTKTKTAVLCVLLAGAPLVIQHQQLLAARVEMANAQRSLELAEASVREQKGQVALLQQTLTEAQAESQLTAAQVQQRAARVAAAPRAKPNLYRWSDTSDYVRLPKAILNEMNLTALEKEKKAGDRERSPVLQKDGTLSQVFADALGLNDQQRQEVRETVQRAAFQFDTLAAQRQFMTNSMPPGIGFDYTPGRLFTFVTPAFPEEGAELKRQFQAEIEQLLGPERAEMLMRQASGMFEKEFQDFGKNDRWVAVAPREDGFALGQTDVSKGMSLGGSVTHAPTESVSKLPEPLRAVLEPYFKPKTQP